eukprot:Skav233830  [mRNA]  locus=scaffold2623:28865:39958:+ [translate_table: standard]
MNSLLRNLLGLLLGEGRHRVGGRMRGRLADAMGLRPCNSTDGRGTRCGHVGASGLTLRTLPCGIGRLGGCGTRYNGLVLDGFSTRLCRVLGSLSCLIWIRVGARQTLAVPSIDDEAAATA